MQYRILLADDHSMLLTGLRGQIETRFGYRDIHSVRTCNKVLEELKGKEYSHLILDISLSDGSSLEILHVIRSLYPALNVMIFSARPAGAFEKALKKYQIQHYLSKDSEEEETIAGLRRFFNNEPMPARGFDPNPFSKLSPRELEVLPYLLQGKGTNEISALLNLSPSTVTEFKSRIFKKTETMNVAELINLAIANNMR
ncbi:MAG TPA: response regulator transcription factor [Puia sp.]|jgi:two-component system invasion response regulator UvrY|nr:response regulator transcription factor [Puia sp.]